MKNLTYKLFTLLTLILLIGSGNLLAQDQGSFFIRNHLPKEYRKQVKAGSPENHAFMQDERGVIYVSNNAGLLEYDGVRWKLLPYDQPRDMRSIQKTSEGVIAVGGRTEIGIFQLDAHGEYQYQSLNDQLEADSANQLTFWYTYKQGDQVYFASYFPSPLRIYRLDRDKITLHKRIQIEGGGYKGRFYVIENEIYGHAMEKGFAKVSDEGKWEYFEGTEAWKDKMIYRLIKLSDQTLLAGTFSGELFTIDLTHQQPVTPWVGEAAEYCTQNQMLHVERLADGNLIFGTVKGGAFISSPEGKIIKTINKQNNLQDNIVFDALEDRQGGIWLGLFKGVSRVQINSPLNFWGEDLGLEGRASAVTRFKDVLIVNTVLGSYYLKNGQFNKIDNSPIEAGYMFHFYPNNDSTQEKLLLSGFDGLYELTLDRDGIPSLQKLEHTYGRTLNISASLSNPNRLYLSGMTGAYVLDYEDGTWSSGKKMEMDGRRLGGSIYEDKEGYLWLSSVSISSSQVEAGEITRVKIDDSLKVISSTVYDTAAYHIPRFSWHQLEKDTLLGFSNRGIYYYDQSSDTFKPYEGFGGIFAQGEKSPIAHYFDPNSGNLWVDLKDEEGNPNGKMAIYYKNEDGSYTYDETSLVRLSEESIGPWLFAEGDICWIPTSNGVYRFDARLSHETPPPYSAIIRRVSSGVDSLLYSGNYFFEDQEGTETVRHLSLSQMATPELPYCDNTVKIQFSALFFEKSEELEYSYILEGLGQETWSAWERENKIIFNNLREGSYKFRVKARNIYGQESIEAVYDFDILPPWQRTKLAYTGYVSLLVFFIWAVVKLNGLRLKKHNEMLTKLVRERTHEIHSKNEELRTQQEEILSQSENLKQANEEILAVNDSLHEQKEEVQQTNNVLNQQKMELQKAYNHITDSVRYAERIQRAILGEAESIVNGFKDGFIFFKPRDIVSGDFYWYSEVDGKKIVIAADCTGHGVPGAFMTVMGNSMLHQIVNEQKTTCPSAILTELDKRITSTTNTKNTERTIHDGMDVAIAVFDDAAGKVYFSGAKNPMIAVQNGELTVLKGSKFPIGSTQFKVEKQFDVQTLDVNKGDRFYLFSDGFQDQFGGLEDTKYLKKRFRGLIASHSFLPMNEQKEKLDSEFRHWKGQKSQTDDILVIGLEVG